MASVVDYMIKIDEDADDYWPASNGWIESETADIWLPYNIDW